jgi:hypothetical protein
VAVRHDRLRGPRDNDLFLWLPSINAIVTGDSLSDFGDGLSIQLGGRTHVTREDVARGLQPLLDLPIELVLPAHGEPMDRAALERGALSELTQSRFRNELWP